MKLFLLNGVAWADDHAAPQGTEHASTTEHTAGHGGDHHAEIPWGSIGVQAFNFGLLIVLLAVLLRKAVKAHFAGRAQSYKDLVDRAENARREAQRNKDEMQKRLENLEASAQNNVAKARAEAEELRNRLMTEAKELTHKMEEETKRATAVELEKAKAHLRKDLLEKALAASNEFLKKGLGSSEQKKLQNEFAEKIEVVGG